MTPSQEQQRIYDALKQTKHHICISATAGSGKTTTILECLKLVPRFSRCIFLSFSNTIVNELKERVPPGIKAATLHSLGFNFIKSINPTIKLDENKYFLKALHTFYTKQEDKNKDSYRDCYRIQDICTFTRMTLKSLEFITIRDMCNYYNLDYTEELIKKAINLLKSKESYQTLDFSDMLYMPVTRPEIVTQKYDYVFLDEAQDLNNCQLAFVESLLVPSGRLIFAGDEAQSIFSFTGSSIDIFSTMQKRENTITLNLSTSYRCGKNIVKKAQEINNFIQPFIDNEDGLVRSGNIYEIEEGDLVLCRTTRPLIALFFELLESNKKATIVGKDIETGLLQLQQCCKSSTHSGYLRRFQEEEEKLIQELHDIGFRHPLQHPRYGALIEKIDVLKLLLRNCENINNLSQFIQTLFKPSRKAVRLMTLHKSKGLENERIFIIERYEGQKLLPSKYANQPWEKTQEKNLEFVGYTRAKKELVFCDL